MYKRIIPVIAIIITFVALSINTKIEAMENIQKSYYNNSQYTSSKSIDDALESSYYNIRWCMYGDDEIHILCNNEEGDQIAFVVKYSKNGNNYTFQSVYLNARKLPRYEVDNFIEKSLLYY